MAGGALLLTKRSRGTGRRFIGWPFLQLRDKAAADDATQETMLTALEGIEHFRSEASVKTWLFAILRHKVVDVLRLRGKYVPAPGEDSAAEFDVTGFDTLFDAEGCWAAPKDAWADPETEVERKAFFKVLEACLTRLPPRTARAFLMREWLDFAPEEVPVELDVTPGNLRVLCIVPACSSGFVSRRLEPRMTDEGK
jgi:RNA polymerase sigma-70 factor (ECF subfamily)